MAVVSVCQNLCVYFKVNVSQFVTRAKRLYGAVSCSSPQFVLFISSPEALGLDLIL